jgi:hypothetical protein
VPERFADGCEPCVPDIERRFDLVGQPSVGLLQQHVALPQDAVELEARGVVLRCKCNECVVEEAAPFGRTTLDEHEVVGREDAHPHRAEQIAAAREALPVDLHPVAALPGQLGLDQHLATVVLADRRPDDREIGVTRINASGGAPRKLDSVARYAIASARLVLPCPLRPSTAVTPAVSSNVAAP